MCRRDEAISASHRIASHRIASHRIASHRIASHHITSHHITSHYITVHYITLHCIILHYIALHCIALPQGDLLLTGTPAGVGAVFPGDVITAGIDELGLEASVEVTSGGRRR